jgi:hypothetical protein
MNKPIVLTLVSAFFVTLIAVSALQAMNMPTADLTMNASQGKVQNPMYTPVVMPHQLHVQKIGNCMLCHHKWNDPQEQFIKCTSSGCHDLLNAQGPEMNNATSSYFAYHSRDYEKSCIGCHLMKQKAGEATGPISCTKCHPCQQAAE